jgi:hypothetical protein
MPGFLLFQHSEFGEPGFNCAIRASVQSGELGDLVAFIKSFQQKAVFFRCPWLSLFPLLCKALYFIDGKIEPFLAQVLVRSPKQKGLTCAYTKFDIEIFPK